MRLLRRILFRWRRARLECELAEELDFHYSMKLSENRGAVDVTRRQMGNMTLAVEESRETWSFLMVERFWHDLRYGWRTLRKNPGFTAVAVLSLALGIGGNAAVFSLVNTLLLRPLPYPDPDRLVRVTGTYPNAALVFFQEQSRTMDVASVSPGSEFNLTGQGEAVRLFGSAISTNLFSTLRVQPARGRDFEAGEDRPGRDAIVILSHSLWQGKFGGDAEMLGRVIALDGIGRTVVGVMPPDFSYPSARTQFWVPARLDPASMVSYWAGEFTPLVARLRPGANIAQARNEIRSLVPQVRRMFPFPMKRDWNADATAIPLQEDVVGRDARRKLLLLLGAVAAVLLIACANVASLLLSRGTVRRREIALRASLGAGRGRIARQLLTESVLVSLLGGTVGVLLGAAALSVFRSVLPQDIPGLGDVRIDLQVLGFATGLAVITGLAFGIAPALSASQVDLTQAIKTGGQRSAGRLWTHVRNWLIAGELALTVVLVVAAGLLVKTVYVLVNVDSGFRAGHTLTVRIAPNQSLCEKRAACVALYTELVRRVREIPGVSAAAVANTIPLDGKFELSAIAVDVENHPKSADFPAPMFWAAAVSQEYFSMMNIPLLAGRGLTEADGAESAPVLLLSAATAKRYWPKENAIGKHIKEASETRWRTVVGVVADVRQYDLAAGAPNWITGAIYMPYPQSINSSRQAPAAMNLLVQTATGPERIGREIRRLAIDQNPNAPVSEVKTMDAVVSDSIAHRRSTMGLFMTFAIVAIILGAVGIYGLISYSVSQRTYEIGLRMAVGATKANVLAMILAQAVRVGAAGIGVGILASLLLTRFLSSLLYGVETTDPVTFTAVGALLFATTAAAGCVPAWRAAKIDPTKSLRAE